MLDSNVVHLKIKNIIFAWKKYVPYFFKCNLLRMHLPFFCGRSVFVLLSMSIILNITTNIIFFTEKMHKFICLSCLCCCCENFSSKASKMFSKNVV